MMVSTLVFIFGGLGGLTLWHSAGAAVALWEFAICLVVLPYAAYLDVSRRRRRRRERPDENWHELPLLNAMGFDDGVPVLPGTREGKRWLRTHKPLRPLTVQELKETADAR